VPVRRAAWRRTGPPWERREGAKESVGDSEERWESEPTVSRLIPTYGRQRGIPELYHKNNALTVTAF